MSTDALFIPELATMGPLDGFSAQRTADDVLSVDIRGPQAVIRRIAARMMIGQLYAVLGTTPIKLLRFTVMNQASSDRLVFFAKFREREADGAGREVSTLAH